MNTREFYEHISYRYSNETLGDVTSLRSFQRAVRTEAVLKMLDKHVDSAGFVIDVGCGPAQYARPILERGHKYFGVDLVPEMYSTVAKELAADSRVRFSQGSIEQIPTPADSADAVLTVGVLEYLTRSGAALAEIRRILKPKGIAIVTLPSFLNPIHFVRTLARPIVAPVLRAAGARVPASIRDTAYVAPIPYRVFVPSRFIREAEQEGLSVIDVHSHGYSLFPWDRTLHANQVQRAIAREQVGARYAPGLASNFIACLRRS